MRASSVMIAPSRPWRGLALSFVVGVGVAAGCGLATQVASAAPPPPTIGPMGPWVVKNSPPIPRGTDSNDGVISGVRTLLRDEQVHFVGGTSGTQETFQRFVFEIVGEAGPRALSQVTSEYDPSYEKLVWHDANVRRAGATHKRLNAASLHLVRREKAMDSDMLDGLLTSALILDDLRVGDVVDWSYTRAGRDPTLAGKLGTGFTLAPEAKVASQYTSLIVERSDPPTLRMLGPEAEKLAMDPVTSDGPNGRSYTFVWSRTDVGGLEDESGAPRWYVPRPYAQLTTFASWDEVARTEEPLFRTAVKPDPTIVAWAKQKRGSAEVDLERYLFDAARFVQDEVRYVALELGMSRRRPAPAPQVLARRYGDCKDKAALLIALLEAGGIEAHPALVSTSIGGVLPDRAPSATLFDHVIVQAIFPSGAVRWIDATDRLAGGGADRFRYSPFGHALVIPSGSKGSTRADGAPIGLTALEAESLARPLIEGEDHITTPDPSGTAEATLTVKRLYRGDSADQMRVVLAGENEDARKKRYVDLYRDTFPQVHAVRPVTLTDDRVANELSIEAQMATPGYWSADQESKRHIGAVPAMLIGAYLWPPETEGGARRAPYAVGGPVKALYDITIELPVPFSYKPDEEVRRAEAFTLVHTPTVSGNTLRHRFEITVDRGLIAADAYAAHQAAARDARELLRRQVFIPMGATAGKDVASGGWEPKMLLVVALLLALVGWGALRVWRYDPPLPSGYARRGTAPIRHQLGGWLVVMGLSLTLKTLGSLASTLGLLASTLSVTIWRVPPAQAGFGSEAARFGLLSAESLVNLVFPAYFGLCVALLYKRREALRVHLPILGALVTVLPVLDHAAAGMLMSTEPAPAPAVALAAMYGIVWAVIWGSYLQKSRRVAETLVFRHDGSDASAPTASAEMDSADESQDDAAMPEDEPEPASAEEAADVPKPKKRRRKKKPASPDEPGEAEAPAASDDDPPAPAASVTIRRRPKVKATEQEASTEAPDAELPEEQVAGE